MTTDRQAAISDIGAFVDDYVEFYALDDGECYHEPTEHERLLIEDAINGLVADDKFEELMAAPITAERDALRAEVERLRAACSRENDTISQVLGRALGYPRFADDQNNFPGATDADGVCVGDHVAASLADEAADCIRTLRSENTDLRDVLYRNGFRRCDVPSCNCGSWHHRFGLPERMAEIKDALADAGHPLTNDNGNKPLNALAGLVSERDALREAADELLEACDTSDGCCYGTLSTSFIKQVLGERGAESLRAEVERLRAGQSASYQRGYTEALNDCIRNGGEQWARSMFADGGDAIDAARAAQGGKT